MHLPKPGTGKGVEKRVKAWPTKELAGSRFSTGATVVTTVCTTVRSPLVPQFVLQLGPPLVPQFVLQLGPPLVPQVAPQGACCTTVRAAAGATVGATAAPMRGVTAETTNEAGSHHMRADECDSYNE